MEVKLRGSFRSLESTAKAQQANITRSMSGDSFYPRGASYARVLAVVVCLCVCLSVKRRYRIKPAKRRITQTTPRDSSGNLFF